MKRAFTLIELLVVIAIIAILAAILFPVFARAKLSAKITSSISGLKQVALGLQMYSTDYDDMVVYYYGYGTLADPNQYHNNTTWVGNIYPYVKNRGIFFDKVLADPKETGVLPSGQPVFLDPFYGAGYEYRWEWVTNFSINSEGYSVRYDGTDCLTNWGSTETVRSQTGFPDPAKRLAVAPTRYANLPFSWMYFQPVLVAWPGEDYYATGWDPYQLIYDTRKEYQGPRFIGAFADGHAGKYGKEKFGLWPSVAPDFTSWCNWFNGNPENTLFWGNRWGD
jgi:prepilin-type N-terminal cleavage/methylation domain-containing protein